MTTIKLKNGSGAPTAGDLVQGEPALDLTNKRLYTEDSGGTVIEVGTNPGTDVTFADNRKAIFGAGSDLQIVHDGSNSYISELGSGDLILQTNGAKIGIAKATPFEWMLEAETDGAVSLYHDNSKKLATTSTGIDVTGTVTADDSMLVEGASGSTLTLKNTTTGAGQGVLIGTVDFFNSDTSGEGPSVQARIKAVTANAIGNGADLQFFTTDASGGSEGDPPVQRMEIDQLGDISFYNDAGTSQDFYWDASTSRLGLGTTSPSYVVHASTADNTIAQFQSTDNRGAILISDDDTNSYIGSEDGSTYISNIGGALSSGQLVINSSGNVGIGTASPSRKLHVADSANIYITANNTAGSTSAILLGAEGGQTNIYSWTSPVSGVGVPLAFTVGSEAMRITSAGNVGIGTSSPSSALTVAVDDATGDNGARIAGVTDGNKQLRLAYNTTGNYANIQAIHAGTAYTNLVLQKDGGNVGIGTSSPTFGLSVESDNGSGYAALFRKSSSDPALTIQTTSSITQIQGLNSALSATNDIAMQVSGGNVGIGTASPSTILTIQDTSQTLGFSQTTDVNASPANQDAGEFVRFASDVGSSGLTFSAGDARLLTGTVNTDNTVVWRANNVGLLATDSIRFYTSGGSERVRILQSGGITFNGDTATANALDDYEEGTFTPAYAGVTTNPTVTHDIQSGFYTKIGRQVFCQLTIRTSAVSSQGSGQLKITGLPFAATNTSNQWGLVNVSFATGFGTDNAPISGYVTKNTSEINLLKPPTADIRDGLNTEVSAGALGTAGASNYLILSVMYTA